MGSHIIDDSLRAVLDQELEQLKGLSYFRHVHGRCGSRTHLVDLSPFLGGLFCEAFVYHGHDLVEDLTAAWSDIGLFGIQVHGQVVLVEGSSGNLVHHGGGRSPRLIVGGFSDLYDHQQRMQVGVSSCFADLGLHLCIVHDR